ncbi:MAG: ABC transporter permease [Oscillospiraceae bacterium]
MKKDSTVKYKKKSQIGDVWRRFRKNKAAMTGLIILLVLAFLAIFASAFGSYEEAILLNGAIRLNPPGAGHIFGTDHYGRDVFLRIVHGAQVSLTIGLAVTAIAVTAGALLGAVAGFYGGIVDNIIMRIMDVFMCIPGMLLALAIVAALGTSLTNLLIALTIAYIPTFVRLTRSSILTVAGADFVEAAHSYGASDWRIITKYILPNALGPVIVQATMSIAGVIISAAAMSYLGMGIQPPAPEWGAMLSEAKEYMNRAPYLLYIPGIAILLSALSFNLVGDGLRDALDPKLKN